MNTITNGEFERRDNAAITIRLAAVSDAHRLARLRYIFRSSFGLVRESEAEFVERCMLWMQERLRQADFWRCWMAERDGALLGNVWIQMIEKVPNPTDESENHAYLTNFYVTEDARGKGTGSMLLSAALDWCRDCQVHSVILWPTEKSRPLYLRHGFSVRDGLLELPVAEPDKT
jgi:GNAT superfamily N-acetyltransferase